MADFAPHNMSSSTAPSPYIVTYSSQFGGLEAWRAFNGTFGTSGYWIATASSGWIALYIGTTAKILGTYSLKMNTIPEPNRAPRDWTVLGSTNGTDWNTIDTVSSQTSWGSGESRDFTCDTRTTAYNYFKINITANNGDASYTQIGEIYFYEDVNRLSVSSLTAQIEYDIPGNQKVSAVNAQVEYDVPGKQLVSHVSAQIEYQGDKWQQNASLTGRHLADTSDLLVDHTFNAHDLTASASAPTVDSGDYKEGINSAVYARASSQYHYITDANLKSGFPLKSGDTVKQGTWCGWVKFTTLTASTTYVILSKGTSGTNATRSLDLYAYGPILQGNWFYNTSGGFNTFQLTSSLQIDRWYHIALAFDGVNKKIIYRVWDDTAGSFLCAGSFDSLTLSGGALNVESGNFTLGQLYNYAGNSLMLNGKINAVHVFNRVLGFKEIDAIRSGTWTKQEDYMGLDVSQVQAQVEYDTFQAQRVYQVGAQVEVDDVVSYTSQLLSQVEYEEPPNLYTSQLLVQVEYTEPKSFSASISPSFRTQLSGAASHRYWRILTNTCVVSNCGVAEYELHNSAGGADLTGSGTASASSFYDGSHVASNAVDNNNITMWASASSAPQWWQYDFGSGNSYGIVEVRITARVTYYTQAGSSISLQYSDNGTDFTTQKTITGLTWTYDNEIKTLDFSDFTYPDLDVETSKSFSATIGSGFSTNSDADILSERLLAGSIASSASTSEPDLDVAAPAIIGSINAAISTSTPTLSVAGGAPEGSIVWGQITGVVETIHSFADNWTGTGEVVDTGDGETIELEDGEYMECSPVNTGTQRIEIIKDGY